MSSFNQINTAKNSFQGDYKKVLCVCSAGCLRSPTAAVVLSQEPFNFNTRAVGLETSFAIIPITDVLLEWADEIVTFEASHEARLKQVTKKPIKTLGIQDMYEYRNPELMEMIKTRYQAL